MTTAEGPLTSETKATLQHVAQVLGLTTNAQKEILARINVHLDASPMPILRGDSPVQV